MLHNSPLGDNWVALYHLGVVGKQQYFFATVCVVHTYICFIRIATNALCRTCFNTLGKVVYYILTGESLLTGSGPKWYRTRRLLTPAFHFDILKPYVKVYCECVDVLLVSLFVLALDFSDAYLHMYVCVL